MLVFSWARGYGSYAVPDKDVHVMEVAGALPAGDGKHGSGCCTSMFVSLGVAPASLLWRGTQAMH